MARRYRGNQRNRGSAPGRDRIRKARTTNATPEGQMRAWQEMKARTALNREDGDVSKKRQVLLDRWSGDLYGNEREGYSKAITREVYEAVEWCRPELIRALLGGDKVVTFTPTGHADEDQSRVESDVIHQLVTASSEHYESISNWVSDALIYPNAYLSVTWDEDPVLENRQFKGMGEDFVELLKASDEIDSVTITEVKESGSGTIDEAGEEVMVKTFDGEAEVIIMHGSICIDDVPPDELLVDNRHLSGCLDSCKYVERQSRYTVSDVVEKGVPYEVAVGEPPMAFHWGEEETSRKNTNDENSGQHADTGTQKWIRVYEAWQDYDFDGDDIAERRHTFRVGTYFHINEADSYTPIINLVSRPQAHRHLGYSMAESVTDLQDQNTALTRQRQDNLYRTNRPRQFSRPGVDESELLNYIPGGVVVMEDPHNDVVTEQIPVMAQHIEPVLEANRERAGARSGSNAGAAGLNPDVLTKTPMGSFMAALQNSNRRTEQVARDMAELGFKILYLKVHELLRRNSEPFDMKIRGEWQTIDPSTWRKRTATSVTPGMGSTSVQQRLAACDIIREDQIAALPWGMSSVDKIYRTQENKMALLGYPDAAAYFNNPNTEEGRQAMKRSAEQKQRQADEQKQLVERQLSQADNEVNRRAIKDQRDQEIKAMETQFKHSEHQDDLVLREEELEREYQFNDPRRGWQGPGQESGQAGGPGNGAGAGSR